MHEYFPCIPAAAQEVEVYILTSMFVLLLVRKYIRVCVCVCVSAYVYNYMSIYIHIFIFVCELEKRPSQQRRHLPSVQSVGTI